jgi:hypothetical protein
MERVIDVHIEKLPEGVYLAASEDTQGPVAQGWTATETLGVARDVARRLLEAKEERQGATGAPPVSERQISDRLWLMAQQVQ